MFGRLLLLLLVPLALAGCRSEPAAVIHARPALWVVRDADTTIYLFGTAHVLPPGVAWDEGRVHAAMSASRELVLEIAPGDNSQIAPPVAPVPLSRAIDATTMDRVRAELERRGLSGHMLDTAPVWYASVTLSNLALVEAGVSTENGVEAALARIADDRGMDVIGLETVAEQFGNFDRIPAAAQRAILERSLAALPGTGERTRALVTAWSHGDLPAIERAMANGETSSPEVKRLLVTDRNARWADWVARRMARPGAVFLAVGAGHLAGDAGLPRLLATRGLTVERLE